MSTNEKINSVVPVPSGVGGAVGVESRKWYVAIVNNNSEKAVEERLSKLQYETYVAKQPVLRVWKNGRRTKVEKVVIPSMVFVRCTERERREVVMLPYINRFLTNRAATSVNGMTKPLATISQREIDTLRFMLGQSDIPVTFVDRQYETDDRIEIIRGSLQGLEGEVVRTTDGKSKVIVRIDILGCAMVEIETTDIRPAKK